MSPNFTYLVLFCYVICLIDFDFDFYVAGSRGSTREDEQPTSRGLCHGL